MTVLQYPFSDTMPLAELDLPNQPLAYPLHQQIDALARRLDVMELELQFYKSQEFRTVQAFQYAEWGVAKAFGLLPNLPDKQRHLAFYRPENRRKAGRPCKQQDILQENYQRAKITLCSILHVFFGMSIHQLGLLYGIQKEDRLRMVRLYEVIHLTPAEVTPKDQELYDTYAAKFRLAYRYMKTLMLQDGYWDAAYDDPELT